MRDKIIAAVLLVVMIFKLVDVIVDISLGVPDWHIISESFIVIISGIGAVFLIRDIKTRTSDISRLTAALTLSDDKLKNLSEEMKKARRIYSEVIHSQFEQWTLTKSEQEIAMLLLKGLSFKEISDVRTTKEKTTRQQASIIYSKANVEGRHEFAAWFLEDFMLVR